MKDKSNAVPFLQNLPPESQPGTAAPRRQRTLTQRAAELNAAYPSIGEQEIQNWSGALTIAGCVESDGIIRFADEAGIAPDFFCLCALKHDGSLQRLADYNTEQEAQHVVRRLTVLFALIERGDIKARPLH